EQLGTRGAELSERLTEFEDALGTSGRQLHTALATSSNDLRELFDSQRTSLVEQLGTRGVELAGRLAELQNALNEGGRELHAALATSANNLRVLLDSQRASLVERLGIRGEEITQGMTNVGETVTQALEGRGIAIVQRLGERQEELVTAIEASSARLRDAFEAGATASIGTLVETHEKLRGEMAEIRDRLAENSASLHEAINAANGNFASVEHSLSDRLQDFTSLLSQVTQEVETLKEAAAATLGQADAVADTIARHHETLSLTGEQLARSQGALDEMLEVRRVSLEGLLANLDQRRRDFASMMQSFATLAEESFQRAETRAREIGTFLTEASQSTDGLIETRFAEIRATMNEERERAMADLRATCDETNTQLGAIFGQTDRFQSAAAEMRTMGQQIQQELETTREALRRSTIDLPRETAEQAASMRRVVADQVKALDELRDIVTRSGRALDIAEPSGQTRQVAPPPPRPVQETQRPWVPTRPTRATVPPPAERGPGWLSDLLARASNEEAQEDAKEDAKKKARSQSPAKPLDPISLDVARMIDQEAAADAWQRYRRGDTQAFSPKIYVGRGQQTFEEVRRRYRSDPEFHNTVDRYVQEFEKILAQRDNQDENAQRDYLLSDTGKVYTMLAHAAGRLS
ncbi:MAG TPA: apolipoprotein acyltransferase, partial [Beijerinckia sp.]|nr:apolipoprotein acyltransferase [Beijerinckia sp.]